MHFHCISCDTADNLHRSALCCAAMPAANVITGGRDSRTTPLVTPHRPDTESGSDEALLSFLRFHLQASSFCSSVTSAWLDLLCFVDLSGRWPFLPLHSHSANANPLVIFLFPLLFLCEAECFPRSDVTFRKAKTSAELFFFFSF